MLHWQYTQPSGRSTDKDSNVHKSTAASPQMSHCFEHCTRGSLWHDHDSGDEAQDRFSVRLATSSVEFGRTCQLDTDKSCRFSVIHYQLHFSVEPFFGRCRFHSRLRCERQSRHRSSSRGEVRFCGAGERRRRIATTARLSRLRNIQQRAREREESRKGSTATGRICKVDFAFDENDDDDDGGSGESVMDGRSGQQTVLLARSLCRSVCAHT